MKFRKSSSNDSESLSEINIIPLVDIMLVLLIIFMVAAPMLNEGIEVNLPEVSAASVDVGEEDFVLSIDELGQIYVNDDTKNKFSIVNIEERLLPAFKDKPEKVLYLRADQSIKYGYVMEIMAAARRAGVEKIGMITESSDDKEMAEKARKKG